MIICRPWNVLISHGILNLNSASNRSVERCFKQTFNFANKHLFERNFLNIFCFTPSSYFYCSFLAARFFIHSQHSETSFIQFSAMNCSNISYFDHWNLLDTTISKPFEKLMKPSQTEELLSHTRILHVKVKMMIKATTLRIMLNLFKVKNLWNQMQVQLILHNKFLCKSQNHFLLRYLLDKYHKYL